MAVNKEILSAEEQFGKYVVQQARSILTRKHKNASKELYNSITFEIDKNGNVLFYYADQGNFVESGRRKGAKMPPVDVVQKWIKLKGLEQWRDDRGRYISRKAQAFLISRSISKRGIKPLAFFSDPFERALQKFPEILQEAIEKVLSQQMESLTQV